MSVDGERRSLRTLHQRLRGATSRTGNKRGCVLLFHRVAVSNQPCDTHTHAFPHAHTGKAAVLGHGARLQTPVPSCGRVGMKGSAVGRWPEGRQTWGSLGHHPPQLRHCPAAPCLSLAAVTKIPWAEGLKQQRFIFSQFWRL